MSQIQTNITVGTDSCSTEISADQRVTALQPYSPAQKRFIFLLFECSYLEVEHPKRPLRAPLRLLMKLKHFHYPDTVIDRECNLFIFKVSVRQTARAH